MLRVIQTGNSLPFSYIVDPSAEFEPGQIAQLTVNGNQVCCGVSDGRAPIGIIDDMRSRAFSAPSIGEVVKVAVDSVDDGTGRLVTVADVKVELKNPNILAGSFASTVPCTVNQRNGVVTFVAGTPLNLDDDGDTVADSIRAVVNYRYQIPNVIGDDSTAGSGRVTVWFQRFIGETDIYETNQIYPLNANLFVSETGILTTRKPTDDHPAVAIVVAPPSQILGTLQFCWL